MTTETPQKSYKAVRCVFCAEPIPLSKNLLSLCVVESEKALAEHQRRSEVFTLRCDTCHKESSYLKTDIENIIGDPHEANHESRVAPKGYGKTLRKAAGQ